MDAKAEKRSEIARQGGLAVKAKYGDRYLQALGALGGQRSGDARYKGVTRGSVTLRGEQWDTLADLAERCDTSVSALVRVAVDGLLQKLGGALEQE